MPPNDDSHHVLRELLTLPGAAQIVESHRWSHEGERLQELVVAILRPALAASEGVARDVADRLEFLDLLKGEKWADADPDQAKVLRKRTLRAIVDFGIPEERAELAATAIAQLAAALRARWAGKVQRCLRELGEQLLAKLIASLPIGALSPSEHRAALVYWLQNVTSLPLSLTDESLDFLCKAKEIALADLVAAADDLDINVGVLDDLAYHYAVYARSAEDV